MHFHTLRPAAAIAALLLAPVAAHATGYVDPVVVTPVELPTETFDWSGAYVGGQLLALSSVGEADDGFYDGDAFEQTHSVGVFAGYNFQNGNLVYGGEIGFVAYDAENESYPGEFLEHFIELRGRVGYAMNDFLFYGALGVSAQNWTAVPAGGPEDDLFGFSGGVGVDYAINDSFFVGAEISYRSLSNTGTADFEEDTFRVEEPSLRLRAGFNF